MLAIAAWNDAAVLLPPRAAPVPNTEAPMGRVLLGNVNHQREKEGDVRIDRGSSAALGNPFPINFEKWTLHGTIRPWIRWVSSPSDFRDPEL